ncbi:hypothetical protein [Clostridium felsineum]|uniref:hypothetical protein n=1 Tax=Clostridium felsineum TaxID=36839 RepID=UPI00203439DE|nr:hypothetical protein [Clostridium felsineum]
MKLEDMITTPFQFTLIVTIKIIKAAILSFFMDNQSLTYLKSYLVFLLIQLQSQ